MKTTCTLATPVGVLRIEAEDGGVVAIQLPKHPGPTGERDETVRDESVRSVRDESVRGEPVEPRTDGGSALGAVEADPVLAEACRQLGEYFDGHRTTFDFPLRPRGTPFQQAVWYALRAIPAGETRTYADIARAVGRPSAVRAVGAANGANPIAIVVPCHRVIGSSGALTGYAGGLPMKRWLLAHEGRQRTLPALASGSGR